MTLKVHNAEFVKSAPSLRDVPSLGGLPEFVLVGRSNVGKSSFINTVLGRKNLAKTSNTPGKTRLLNYYLIDNNWVFVDLPGYGYAKVSKTEQRTWQKNFEEFLKSHKPIRLVIQLIDARHGPQESDRQMFEWLAFHELPQIVVLTKADKISRNELSRQVARCARELAVDPASVIAFSATEGTGKKAVLDIIGRMIKLPVGPPGPTPDP